MRQAGQRVYHTAAERTDDPGLVQSPTLTHTTSMIFLATNADSVAQAKENVPTTMRAMSTHDDINVQHANLRHTARQLNLDLRRPSFF